MIYDPQNPDFIIIIEHVTKKNKYISVKMHDYAWGMFRKHYSKVIRTYKSKDRPKLPRIICLIVHQGKTWTNLESVNQLCCNAPDNNLAINFVCELSLLNISKVDFTDLNIIPECELLLLLLQGKYKFNV
jgi:hypothetical protein